MPPLRLAQRIAPRFGRCSSRETGLTPRQARAGAPGPWCCHLVRTVPCPIKSKTCRDTKGDSMSLLLSWLILSIAVWITAAVLPGFHVKDFVSAVLVAAVFGILNFLLGWLFFAVFTILTLGLAWLLAFITRWIINAILLMLVD